MPELPEVETIRRSLAPRLEGRRLAEVEIHDARWCRPAERRDVAAALRGRRVERLGRRGKYLLWQLEGDRHLVAHLRMTGTLLYDPVADVSHRRVEIALDDGHALVWVDPRRFGTGRVLDGGAARDAYLDARLGLEPLDPGFTVAHLRAITRGRRTSVKALLLDQRRVAGVGNIYADEALFRARIHPLRPAGRLSGAQVASLRDAVVAAMHAGLDAGGATIDDFRDPDGAWGAFQDEFLVHRREGEPCPACAAPVRKLVVAGRGTYACERCQPRPRRRRGPPASGAPVSS